MSFQKVAKVERDKNTGQVVGWEGLFELIAKEDENKIAEALRLKEEIDKATASLKNQHLAYDSGINTFSVDDDQNTPGAILITNKTTGEKIQIFVRANDEGKAVFENMPPELNAYLYNYVDQEKLENTLEVIMAVVTMHEAKGNADVNIVKKLKLPTEEEFKDALAEIAPFRTEDPSLYYDITGKLGAGGFARVFKVQRKTDNFVCALKFIEPKNDNERKIIYNEVGLMRMCGENQGILKCIEAFEFKNRLWIFVEIMDDALTPFIETLHNSYSENICKYVLKKSLEGLQYLHAKHIIHRDIKSDNILINTKGEVKLADFGYSVQLTQQKAGRVSKVGTVCWMAPELIKGERRYNTKIDIWSYGIFAMEMANGDPPYINEQQGRVIFNIVKHTPPPLKDKWSAQFQDFVTKCLTKNPSHRPSAEALLQHEWLSDAESHRQEFADLVKGFIALKKQKQLFMQ